MELTTIRSYKAPKDIIELSRRIEDFFLDMTAEQLLDNPISPRLFRISIGVSKQTLSNWKHNENKKDLFDLIKSHEDILLGFIENKTLATDSKNVIGLINTLRAYDTARYVPEFRDTNKAVESGEPIIIKAINQSGHKSPAVIEAIIKETSDVKEE